MGRAKEIEVRVIPSSIANPFIRRHHYSHKVVNKSNLHFGAFLDGKLHGVMSYGTPESDIISGRNRPTCGASSVAEHPETIGETGVRFPPHRSITLRKRAVV